MTREELHTLTQRYLDNTISDEDRIRLQEWYEQGMGGEMQLELPGNAPDEDEVSMANSLYARILPRQAPVRRRWPWLAAAAVILMIIGIGGYFLINRSPQTRDTRSSSEPLAKHSNTPNSNKATLVLGNGRQILLDSAENGQLSQQGNMAVIKTGGGQLAYHAVNPSPSEVVFNTLMTPRGGQYQLLLPDGTKVWLNAASSVRYPTAFTGKERRVFVTGEAYFDVVHNSNMPFRVEARGMTIEDIGTQFNVDAYGNEPEMRTTLLQGGVRIHSTSGNASDGKVLHPGQQATIAGDAGAEIRIMNQVDTGLVVAWKRGEFLFRKTNVKAIMRQIERWYDVEISYDNDISSVLFSGGMPRTENVSQLLELLAFDGRLKFTIQGKKINIKRIVP